MVRAYFPQSAIGSLNTNTNYPGQGEEKISIVDGGWVDDLDDQFTDDSGTPIMFGNGP